MLDFDVLVVGGGNAGCAAAIAASRHGARTLLVERYGFLGGTATAAMVGPWMTFHSGNERIVGGIAQEIVERLMEKGASPGHLRDSSGYVPTITPFDPEVHKALLFEMMREAGVSLVLHAYALGAMLDGDAVFGASFATVGGLREYAGRVVIDATADAFIAASAYVRGHPDQMRTSLKTHERMPAALTAVAGLYDLWEAARRDGTVDIPRELVSFFISPYPDEVTVNMTRVVDIDPLDPGDLTRAEIESRLQVMQLLEFFRSRVPGFENARLAATGAQVGIRESRRIVGRYTLTRDDVLQARQFDDAVARSAYPIDIHNPSGTGTTTHRLAPGQSYEIPYRCLVPINREQLLVAGRCISTTHEALASTRLTPTVMTLGQAAGTAAAIARRRRVHVGDVDASELRETLIADGVDLRRPAPSLEMNA
jgi:FAD dependent oxidoreductase